VTLQNLWVEAVKHVMARTEDVGERFADEARRIHYGEADERGIRGLATADEREALREEGIEVMPLPLPAALKRARRTEPGRSDHPPRVHRRLGRAPT
jgi:hypothetical protein